MAVPVSSLSIAVQGITEFLVDEFEKFSEQISISTDTPQRASEKVKGGDKHLLNLFTYRVAPSGFHADTTSKQPFFIRINVLLTPFLAEQGSGVHDTDLRILGHAIRVLGSHPVVPGSLPGKSVEAGDFHSGPNLNYRMQAVLLAPVMEELNHIWTTQGGELAYRLSAAYEFALIPIEPLEYGDETGPPVRTGVLDVHPEVKEREDGEFVEYADDPVAVPLRGPNLDNAPPPTDWLPPPTDWLPVVLFAEGEKRTNTRSVAPGTNGVDVAIAGRPGEKVALEVSWIRADSSKDNQDPQIFTIRGASIDDPAALANVALKDPADGDVATVRVRPADPDDPDQPMPRSPFANTLSIVTGVPQ